MTNKELLLKINPRGLIALIVVVWGFLTINIANVTQTDKNQIYMLMVLVLTFYFGGSQSSKPSNLPPIEVKPLEVKPIELKPSEETDNLNDKQNN